MRVRPADITGLVSGLVGRVRVMSRTARLAGWSGFVALTVGLSGCKDLEPPPPAPFNIFVKVESDPGHPVVGATIARGAKVLATTGPDGRAMLTLGGVDGENMDVAIKCPETFQSPTKPTTIKLTRFADPKRVPEYAVACPPMLRHIVVAVKADNGPNLPVMYLNRAVTRTDASGAAHFALEVAPGTQFQVTLDTSEMAKMKPASPTKPFTVGQVDDILLFEQKFDMEKSRVVLARPTIPRALN